MDSYEQVLSDAEYEGWPVTFYICKKHSVLFEDYENAIISDTEHCILCHPIENDSLGG